MILNLPIHDKPLVDWDYSVDRRQLTFTGNRYLAAGSYDPDSNALALYLRPGVEISHAETGSMGCRPSEPVSGEYK